MFVRLLPYLLVMGSYWLVWHESLRMARRVQAIKAVLDQIIREEASMFRTRTHNLYDPGVRLVHLRKARWKFAGAEKPVSKAICSMLSEPC